jgi:ketosteroid isomerase-like protein
MTKQDLAAGFHRALTTKDWSLLRSVMSPDVIWTLPGDNTVSGTAFGIEAVIDRAELIAGYGLTFELERVLVSRDNMALALRTTALDAHLATVCTVQAERIVRIETYLSDLDGMNAFFADRAAPAAP